MSWANEGRIGLSLFSLAALDPRPVRRPDQPDHAELPEGGQSWQDTGTDRCLRDQRGRLPHPFSIMLATPSNSDRFDQIIAFTVLRVQGKRIEEKQ